VEVVAEFDGLAGLIFEFEIQWNLLIEPLIDADVGEVRRRDLRGRLSCFVLEDDGGCATARVAASKIPSCTKVFTALHPNSQSRRPEGLLFIYRP